MSTYNEWAYHPKTGKIENALWMDDYFGRHRYGVQFDDGTIWPEIDVKVAPSPLAKDNENEKTSKD